jgi:hypothetical protein
MPCEKVKLENVKQEIKTIIATQRLFVSGFNKIHVELTLYIAKRNTKTPNCAWEHGSVKSTTPHVKLDQQ